MHILLLFECIVIFNYIILYIFCFIVMKLFSLIAGIVPEKQ